MLIASRPTSSAAQVDAAKPRVTRVMNVLQVGSGWFPERPGGLERYYFDLLSNLPVAGVMCRGLVVGSPEVDANSGGRVHAFSPARVPLLRRWAAVRRAANDAICDGPLDLIASHF